MTTAGEPEASAAHPERPGGHGRGDAQRPDPRGPGETVRIRLDLAYDGAPFAGWAVQPGLETVQGSLEEALRLVVREPVRLVVAGRTDAGVHARGQVAHADLLLEQAQRVLTGRQGPRPDGLERRLDGALHRVLGSARRQRGLPEVPGAIVVRRARPAPEGFDARFSAVARRYIYRIDDGAAGRDPLTRHSTWAVRHRLDEDAMHEAAQPLPGLHDFLSFCRPRAGATTIRELQEISVRRTGTGLLEVQLRADAFCHSMVRAIVGSLVRVGQGERPPQWLRGRLEERSRSSETLLAPAQGLVLEEVLYPGDEELAERARLTRARREGP